ncbi:MAG TPA: DUF4143 domain-containing protein [Chlorobaculum sp.]|nr:DUF4143 domain-containing protein [Chlorobaculum sp.]
MTRVLFVLVLPFMLEFNSNVNGCSMHRGRDAGLFFYRDTDQQEVDLVIESGDTLYPVEIKKTTSPSQHGRFGFGALDKLGRNVGPGAVVCFVERDVPLSESVTAAPVGYI